MRFLKCRNISSVLSVVYEEPSNECNTLEYNGMKYLFIYPTMLLWGLIFPLVIIIGMYRFKN